MNINDKVYYAMKKFYGNYKENSWAKKQSRLEYKICLFKDLHKGASELSEKIRKKQFYKHFNRECQCDKCDGYSISKVCYVKK